MKRLRLNSEAIAAQKKVERTRVRRGRDSRVWKRVNEPFVAYSPEEGVNVSDQAGEMDVEEEGIEEIEEFAS